MVRGDQRVDAGAEKPKSTEPKKGQIVVNAKTKKGGGRQTVNVHVDKIVNNHAPMGRYRMGPREA